MQKVNPGRLLIQAVVSIGLFIGLWKAAALINWVPREKVDALNARVESRIGEMVWGIYERSGRECDQADVNEAVDTVLRVLCKANGIQRGHIKLHVLVKDEVNAMALPDGHLVVYTGLLLKTDNQAQLAGVLAHELAHIEERHVMKKLAKELGVAALTSMAGLSGSAEAAREIAEVIASRAYDRSLESDADAKAVEYLLAAHIDPNELADFFMEMAEQGNLNIPDWLNTHPSTEGRSERIRELTAGKVPGKPAFGDEVSWKKIRELLLE
jgi:beta-barrel assembly-enhancing protease